MRGALVALGLALGAPSPSLAQPEPTPGYRIEELAHDLAMPSGAARDGDGIVLTDLGSGKVVRRGVDGTIEALHPGLPTGKDVLGERTGPYKVQVVDGRIFVAQGWQDVERGEGPYDHAILELSGGASRVVNREFWNPYDFAWDGEAWYVADAGRNALFRLGPSGSLTLVFSFPRLARRSEAMRTLSPTEFKEGETYEVDAVPTGVALGAERVYVALFGGFPFLDGGGLVVSLPRTGGVDRARVEVRSLDGPIDVAFDMAGRLLVLEMARYDLKTGFLPGTGRLLRIDLETGGRETLARGLSFPVTVLPEAEGALIVETSGSLLRLSLAP
jgi:hypothetical protein